MFKSKNLRPAVSRWLLLAAVAFSPVGSGQEAPSRSLQALDLVELDGGRVLMTLTMSEAAPAPVPFTIDKPARLIVDLADTRSTLADRFRRVSIGKVRSVAIAEAKGRTRVVVELGEMAAYDARAQGNLVLVEIAGSASSLSSASGAGLPAPSGGTTVAAAVPAAPAMANIAGIDFRRGEKGEARVVVNLGDPRTVVDVREEGGRVVARFRNTAVSDALIRRLDVLDFATPAKFVDTIREGADTRIIVTPLTGAEFEQVAYQAGSLFTLELQPLTLEKKEEKKRQDPQYTGERISLSFQSVDVRSLLQIIADVAGTNMVVSDSVTGTVAMRLQNVPWDQALDIILRTKGLGMRQQGNVMLVAPLGELAARDKAEADAEKALTQAGPLRSEIMQVNYAKASEIAAILKAGGNSLLSDRGRVTIDDRTNTLLVQDTREKLNEIRSLIARLDVPVRQVLIESRIVVANNDFSKDIGAQFGVSHVRRNGDNGLIATSGSSNVTSEQVDDFLGGGFPVSVGSLPDRFNVNLPANPANFPAGSIAFAILGADYLVDLELSALQAEGRGEVISSPRVVTANGKEASIEQGVEIPYLQASSSGATNVAFKKAVLSLTVTPQVTPDEHIIMDLAVNKDSRGQDTIAGPAIDTRKVSTQVLVDNGQTVVLGGIYEQTQVNSITKVPLLGDLPLIGAVFRNNKTISNKAELLIFVTPKVLNERLTAD